MFICLVGGGCWMLDVGWRMVWVSQRLLIISWAFLWPWEVGAMRGDFRQTQTAAHQFLWFPIQRTPPIRTSNK